MTMVLLRKLQSCSMVSSAEKESERANTLQQQFLGDEKLRSTALFAV